MTTPQAAAERAERLTSPGPGPGERFAGYGVMGLPFRSGHYLALRRWPANPFGRPYHSVWHRDPDGRWVFYGDTPTDASCPRYFDAAIASAVMADISIRWAEPYRLVVEVGGLLTWNLELGRTPATTLMTSAARLMPRAMWDNRMVLAAMGRAATPVLRSGRIRLSGTVPNGQWFKASPRQIWNVADSTAILDGVDLGAPGALPEQARLGDFWLPQRGIFWAGGTTLEEFDPNRHRAPRPAAMQISTRT
ncbi:MAG: hypothetical protein ABI438_00425 [Dermatophilaceae bacterium]